MIQRRPLRLRGRSARAVAITVFGIGILGACTSDGEPALPADATPPDGGSDGGGGAAEPAPEPAAEPAPEPAAEPAPESGNGQTASAPDDELTNEEWVLLILLGIAAVAIIIGATSAATSHSQRKQQQQSDRRRRLTDIGGGVRWLLDQGSMSVLQAKPTQVAGAWASVRPHEIDLEGKTAQLAAGSGDSLLDSSLSRLGQELAGLRGAIESYVSACAGGQADLVASSRQTVMSRRQQVEIVLQPITAAQT